MKTINKTTLKKYLQILKKSRFKVVTCEILSQEVGIYPDVIAETFAFFDPMIRMDEQYNLLDLVPEVEEYLQESIKKPKNKAEKISKKEWEQYDSIATFVYAKMTTGGIVNRNIELSDKDLKIMKKLIVREEQERKKSRKKG